MPTFTITIWLPALRKGAPSNTAGMARPSAVYRTRAEALRHEHYASQAPYATAKRVTVSDGSSYVDGFDGENLALQVCEHHASAEVEEHLVNKQWASAIACAMGWR